MLPRDLNSYYQRVAPRYDSLRLDSQAEVQSTAHWILASTSVSGPILEIGCGTGRHGACMAASGREVWSLDKSLAQLTQAPVSLRRIAPDAANLPIRNRVVAACAFIMVIHQLSKDDLKSAISEARRVLLPGGTLFIKTASRKDLRQRPLAEFFPSALELNIRRYPRIDELLLLMTLAGFEAPSITRVFTNKKLSAGELLRSIRLQHNSTLALLPSAEFNSGYGKCVGASLTRTCQYATHVSHNHKVSDKWNLASVKISLGKMAVSERFGCHD